VDHDSLHLYNQQRYFITDNPSGERLTPEQQAQQRERLAAIRLNLDSVRALRAPRPDSINNGADDDGSGTVTVLEVAEAFATGTVKPKRSILFVWHTGEEKGLLGSRYFTDNPTVPRDSIVAQINIDMVGRGAAKDLAAGSERYLQLVGSRRLSTELGDLVETVNRAEPLPFTFDYTYDANGHPENIYCRSDHYEYARYGIPVVFLTTGLHGDYHQVTDEPQYIDYPHMARIGKLVFDLADRVADLDHRPVVDKAKPDPKGACRQ
jgi:Zn-dependent M28 family amino/carboxypeptidase